jgi:RNA polymerase sigma-70 factor (ECF subfamily)
MTRHFACRVALHTARNARRHASYRARYTPLADAEDLLRVEGDEPSPADAVAGARRRHALRALLDELPDVQAEVLALHIILGYSVQETAAVTGAAHNTVRSRLRAALTHLRSRIDASEALLEVIAGGA